MKPKDKEQDLEVSLVIGPNGEPVAASELTLGIEKFRQPHQHYRLIWIDHQQAEAWLCQEDSTLYRRIWGEDGIIEAGQALAERLGVKRFSGVVR